jgi:hypothetical protein
MMIEPQKLEIGDNLAASRLKKMLPRKHALLDRYKTWMVEDVIIDSTMQYSATKKKRTAKKVERTRIFFVPLESASENHRIRAFWLRG